MATGYVLYNRKAGDMRKSVDVMKLCEMVDEELKFVDVTTISDYKTFLSKMNEDDFIILSGGDGTINKFVNNIDGLDYTGEVLYFPNGTGNDFANEMGYKRGCKPFSIKKYIKDLPIVTVNNKKYRFINGIGYGIDGYCCEVGDEIKKNSDKPVNYTMIAIKGLLFHYKPTNAKVTVDGKTSTYKKVWMAPTMKGKYFGGGMMPTPQQDRMSKDKTLSLMVLHSCSKLKILRYFPSVFEGKHIKYTDIIEIMKGNEITVEFDRPTALQVDGETILGVTSYTAKSST